MPRNGRPGSGQQFLKRAHHTKAHLFKVLEVALPALEAQLFDGAQQIEANVIAVAGLFRLGDEVQSGVVSVGEGPIRVVWPHRRFDPKPARQLYVKQHVVGVLAVLRELPFGAGVRVDDDVRKERLLLLRDQLHVGCKYVPQVVPGEATHLVDQPLDFEVVNTLYQHIALHDVDRLSRVVDECLRILHRIGKSPGLQKNARDRGFRQSGLRLHLTDEIRHNVLRLNGLRPKAGSSAGYACCPDGNVGARQRQLRPLDGRHLVPNSRRGLLDQLRSAVVDAVARACPNLFPKIEKARIRLVAFLQPYRHLVALVLHHIGLETYAGFDHLCLQLTGEILIALVGNYRQPVHLPIPHTLAVLVHGKAQTAPDLLALLDVRAGFGQGANLEYVWIVPALAQRRVTEDEGERLGDI